MRQIIKKKGGKKRNKSSFPHMGGEGGEGECMAREKPADRGKKKRERFTDANIKKKGKARALLKFFTT